MRDLLKKALVAISKHPDSPYIFADSDGKPPKDIRKSANQKMFLYGTQEIGYN